MNPLGQEQVTQVEIDKEEAGRTTLFARLPEHAD
jgi:hypothetical protein